MCGDVGVGVLLGRRPRPLGGGIVRQEWHLLTRWDDIPLVSQAELIMHRALPTAEHADELRARALRRDPGVVGLARERFTTTTVHADGISIVAPGLAVEELDRLLGPAQHGTVAQIHRPYPAATIVFCETRALAEEWTYRFLGAGLAEERSGQDAEGVAEDPPEYAW